MRVGRELLQREVAQTLGCTQEAYFLWETERTIPRPSFYPKIIDFLGYLPDEDLTTYHGVLRSQRLRRGLSMIAMAKLTGANSAAWTRWERGIYVPAFDFLPKLKRIGIDLSRFDLHGDIVPTDLAKALRKARKKGGHTHEQMSAFLGFKSPAAWHRFELQGVVPDRKFWAKINERLSINVTDFE